MLNAIRRKLYTIKYSKEKVRFLLFALVLFLVFFLARYLLGMAYARYEVRAKINANIEKALYIFEDNKIQFNLDPDGIIPSNSSYSYKFSVSNFNASHDSDVDITYKVKIRTTTNLPLMIKLYRNEEYNSPGAVNVLSNPTIGQDEDNAWYRLYETVNFYDMAYTNHVTDVYTIVVDFPSSYSTNADYANYLENIEITLESKQII